MPIGLVVNELLTNALKHAVPPPQSGTVEVQARWSAPGQVNLAVRDDRIGMPVGRGENLGLRIVRSLVRQIGGELEVRSGPGVSVSIFFAA